MPPADLDLDRLSHAELKNLVLKLLREGAELRRTVDALRDEIARLKVEELDLLRAPQDDPCPYRAHHPNVHRPNVPDAHHGVGVGWRERAGVDASNRRGGALRNPDQLRDAR
jgi:hypothetical protein